MRVAVDEVRAGRDSSCLTVRVGAGWVMNICLAARLNEREVAAAAKARRCRSSRSMSAALPGRVREAGAIPGRHAPVAGGRGTQPARGSGRLEGGLSALRAFPEVAPPVLVRHDNVLAAEDFRGRGGALGCQAERAPAELSRHRGRSGMQDRAIDGPQALT